MATHPVQADLDFEKASKILNFMLDPRSSDDTGLVAGQFWFNTTSNRLKGYDGSSTFIIPRIDGADTITGIWNFTPSSGTVPFTVDGAMTSTVTNLNADRVDGYHAAEAATVSTLAARDSSGNLTVATPSSDGHATTKAYVDSIAAGQDWKDSCRVATTANITLSGTQTIDGIAVVADDRVLVKDQTTGSENGIYVCAAGAWSRSTDADADAEVTSGLTTFIEEGTASAGAGFTLTTTGTIVVDTTALTFTKSSGGSVYSAGNGMVKSGTTFHAFQSASYTVGALPYATGASTIGMLSAVASGKVLKSNGLATAPLWASLDLTADVTGVLPVANGGSGTSTQFTEGSVVLAGASGIYAQDNSGLYFNATTNSLGVNTNSLDSNKRLHVSGNALIEDGALTVENNSSGATFELIRTGIQQWDFNASSTILYIEPQTAEGDVKFRDFGNTETLVLDNSANTVHIPNGQLYVGTTSAPSAGELYVYTASGNAWTMTESAGADSNAGAVFKNDAASWTVGINGGNSDAFAIDNGTGLATPLFVIDTSGNVGIGTTTLTEDFEVSRSGTPNIAIRVTTESAGNIADLDFLTGSGIRGNTNRIAFLRGEITQADPSALKGELQFWTNTGDSISQKMVVDSDGNIGVGTTDIEDWDSGYVAMEFPQSSIMAYKTDARLFISNNAYYDGAWKFKTADEAASIALNEAGEIEFRVSNATGTLDAAVAWTTALTINNDGNLGAGTTDIEAWGSGFGAIEFPAVSFMYSGSGASGYWSANAYYDGAWKYKTTDEACQYFFGSNGIHRFRVAASGTVDTAITWTDALTINNDASLSVSSTTLVDNLNADTVDGYEGADLLDLANSTGDTDDIAEGVTNLFYTDARARAALSSAAAAEIAYNSGTGVIGLGTEAARVKSGSIGDGTSTSLTFTHSLGTQDVIVSVHTVAAPYKTITCGVERTSTSQVTLEFNTAPASNAYRVVCVAANG